MHERDVDAVWAVAFTRVLGDPEGEQIRASQSAWAAAVRAELAGTGVTAGGDVFGPALVDDGFETFVVSRPLVLVQAEDLEQTRQACLAAWHRFVYVDENGDEPVHPGDDAERDTTGDFEDYGFPVPADGWVPVGFDVREREEAVPHIARTCLRILVEELSRRGCLPATLRNPLRTADDDVVDIDSLVDDDDPATAAPAPSAASTPAGDGSDLRRPDWLPPFHRLARSKPGVPSGPVPFVYVAFDQVWAWDPGQGLLKLPGWGRDSGVWCHASHGCLTNDGRRIQHTFVMHRPGQIPPWQETVLATYDLTTAERTLGAVQWGDLRNPAVDDRLVVTTSSPPYEPDRRPDRSEYVKTIAVRQADGAVEPVLKQVGGGGICPDGVPQQLSPSGRGLVVADHDFDNSLVHEMPIVVHLDLVAAQQQTFPAVYLHGSATWSPDETQILVRTTHRDVTGQRPEHEWAVHVLHLATGQMTYIDTKPVNPVDPLTRAPAEVLAWLGHDGLLVQQSSGRRVLLSYQPLWSGRDGHPRVRHPILDLPVAGGAGGVVGIVVAADVLRTDPQSVGWRGTGQ